MLVWMVVFVFNENNSITINYNITEIGVYNHLDVFIIGLDPQKLDGVGRNSAIILIWYLLYQTSNFWFGLLLAVLIGFILIV
jgi:hypothetical protein